MEEFNISVIVPVYNTEVYLERCVASLRGQNYKNLEIILVDDGSLDNSGKLCDTYAQQDARIKVIHKKNGGLISAWKRGVEESTGEYLCFVDSDDWVDREMISEMSVHLTGSIKEIISSDYVIERMDGSSQKVLQDLPPGEYEGEALKEKVKMRLLGNERRLVCFSRCMKLISRQLVLANYGYSDPKIRMGEDLTVMLPALLDCERLVIMDHKTYYHYFYIDASMAHGYDKSLYENICQILVIMEKILKDKVSGEELEIMKAGAEREYLLLIFLFLKNEVRGNHKECYGRIKRVCREKEFRELCKRRPLKLKDKSNCLLYFVMKYTNWFTVKLLRLSMILYYRKL